MWAVIWTLICLACFALAAISALNTDSVHTRQNIKVTVQSGQTLWGIVKKYDPTDDPRSVIEKIQKLNGIDANSPISPGEELIIPSEVSGNEK